LAELRAGEAPKHPPVSSAPAVSFSAAHGDNASRPPAAHPPADEDAASLWQTAQTSADPQVRSDALNKLSTLISENRGEFEAMLRRYDPRADRETRDLMRSLLAGDPEHRAEVMEFSLELAASDDPQRREDGFAMLARIGADTPPVLELATRVLGTERDPAVVQQAALLVGQAAVGPAEAQALQPRLVEMAADPNASLRAAGVYTLSRLDKTTGAEPQLAQALADPAPEVRQAALAAMEENAIRSDGLKQALWKMLESDSESPALRDAAAQGLERYPMEQAEYERLKQAQAQLAQHEGS